MINVSLGTAMLMPIVTELSQPSRRRPPVWTAVLAALLALPLGVLGWSWFEPVGVDIGSYRLVFGAMYGPVSSLGPGWHRSPNGWNLTVDLPARIGIYHASCVKPRDLN